MMPRDGRSVYTGTVDGNRMWKPMRDHQSLRPDRKYIVYLSIFNIFLQLDAVAEFEHPGVRLFLRPLDGYTVYLNY